MSDGSTPVLSGNDLLLACRDTLLANGYVEQQLAEELEGSRVFENPYNFVVVVAFDTWTDLRKSWADYQAIAVELMTKRLNRNDPKVWDGYLVLMTPSPVPLEELPTANEIRSNVSRLRKLLGTGDDIRTVSDVKKTILPLLPIASLRVAKDIGSGLDVLPRILDRYGVPIEATQAVVEAFKSQDQLLPRLHELLTST